MDRIYVTWLRRARSKFRSRSRTGTWHAGSIILNPKYSHKVRGTNVTAKKCGGITVLFHDFIICVPVLVFTLLLPCRGIAQLEKVDGRPWSGVSAAGLACCL